jgi:hypothetical protein
MLQQIEKTRNADAEAVLLARVYALILRWSDSSASGDEQKTLDDASAKNEANDDEK